MAGKLLMKPHRVGILGLWVIGVAVTVLVSCSIEEAQPIPANAPVPISTLTARQQEAIDHLKGRKSLATPIPTPTVMLTVTFIPTRTPARLPPPTFTSRQQEALDYATGRKSVGTPTPAPTPTATPVPEPTPVPTSTAVPLTVGELQLRRFRDMCLESGVGDTSYRADGDIHYRGGVAGEYLLDHYSEHPNTVLGELPPIAGAVWQTRWRGVPLEGEGAYSEGGTCLLVYTRFPHLTWRVSGWDPDDTTTIRLIPLGETDLTEEELTFTEGYHFLSREMGYTGKFRVTMWWTGSVDVPQEERSGQVRVFNFWSAGPGRRNMSDPSTD